MSHAPFKTAISFNAAFFLTTSLFIFTAASGPARAQAPAAGSGNLEYKGFVRIIDGDTFEIHPKGNQVGVGTIGIKAPEANTPCGKLTAALKQSLIPFSVSLAEDPKITFDARKRRMYYVLTSDGRSVAQELVKAGLAIPDGTGKEAAVLASLGKGAATAGLGCVAGQPTNATTAQVRNLAARDKPEVAQAGTVSLAAVPAASAASTAAGFSQTVVAGGLNYPTNWAFLPDGRIVIIEKHGVVRIFKNGSVLPAPLIDISSQVNDYWDHGLIGVAIDPNFAANGFVYLFYTFENNPTQYSGTKTARLSRYTVVGDTASPGTEQVILGTVTGASCHDFAVGADCIPSDNPSHSAGSLKFDSSGNLFVTSGEGASFNVVDVDALRAQNLDLLGGKALRVTSTGAGLPGNPFWNGTASANRSKIWSYGMRNPYRMSIRPGTTTPYLGDVGWNTWEEINVGNPGANMGWPCYEGVDQQPGYASQPACQTLYGQGPAAVQAPLFTYNHNYTSAAVTGGVFYTGTTYPAQYQGAYFFGDYAQSWLRYLKVDATNKLLSGPVDFLYNADGPVAIDQGSDGNLYYLSIAKGELRKITYAGGTAPPVTVTSVTPAAGASGVAVNASVQAVFSSLIDPSTINVNTFTLTQQGSPVAASVTYDGAGPTATLTPTLSLQPSLVYTATVKGGASGVKDVSGSPLAADKVWTFTIVALSPPPNGTSFVSDLNFSSVSNGWGPVEHDTSNGENAAGDGKPITIRGAVFAKGLGAHAAADIRYNLGGGCSVFSAVVGIDDEVPVGSGSVVFQVWGDGTKLYDSGLVTRASAAVTVNVNMAGKNELQLVITDGGDGNGSDHGDWANAKITCGGASGPVITSTSPANGASGVALSATVTATFMAAIDPATLTTSTFTLMQQGMGALVAAIVSYNNSNITASLQPNVALQPGITYTATLKGGAGGVKDTAGVPLAADQIWSFSTTTGGSYLSDLTWTSMTNGWGPAERDTSNGESAAGDGHPISIRGTVYPKGLGVHAASDVRYNVGGTCSSFSAVAGVDDEVPAGTGSIVFQVWGDGTKLYESAILTRASVALPITVDISSKNQLQLVVTDGGDGNGYDHGDWANAKITCAGAGAPVPTITSPSSSLAWKVGDVINYAGSAVDGKGAAIPATGLTWNIILHHCPGGACHIHPFTSSTGATGSFTAPDHGDNSYFELMLTATDSTGLTGTVSLTIQPALVALTLATSPTGLQVTYNGSVVTAPTVVQTIIGSAHTISVTSPQGNLPFSSWSDGGAQQHDIVAPATAATYTATFGPGGAPVISAVSASGITSSGATVTWTTDQASDSQVEYGATTAYGSSTTLNTSAVTSHSVALSGLTAGQLYHYRVKSKNAGGQLATSGDFTFTTSTSSPLTVTAVAPAAGATGVAPGAPITAKFSAAMNAATITTTTFTLVKQGTTTVLAATVSYASATLIATLQPTSPLQPGVIYMATVKSGSAGVKDASGRLLSADKVWSFTVATGPPSGVSFVSDLTWTSMANGWGPVERDTSNGESAAGDGRTISIRGATFAKGLGAHAASDVRYNLAGTCSLFSAVAGIDDEVPTGLGSVIFQVWGDGAKLYDSGLLTRASAAVTINVNMTGKNQLQLVVTDGGDGNGNDHADWANAKITCGTASGPVITGTNPANGASGVALNTAVTATFAAAVDPATVTTATFTLVQQGMTTPLAATVTYVSASQMATLQPGAALLAGTAYTATVKSGTGGVKDTAGNPLAADQIWTFTMTSPPVSGYLSDLTWTSMTNGWGPAERDTSNGESAAGDGHTITIRGATYAKGLGVHAASDIRYNLSGMCSAFSAVAGIDDEVPAGTGSVIFQVFADGTKLYDSGVVTRASAALNVNVGITGKSQLQLVVTDAGDGNGYDHGDWANAKITCP